MISETLEIAAQAVRMYAESHPRHTAATMLARKLDVLDLCRMFGWTTTKHALVYYNPSASSIADILNR